VSRQHETWKPIPSLPGYSASNLGRIRLDPCVAKMPCGGVRVRGGEPRLLTITKGRRKLSIRGRSHNVGALICEAFHGPRPFVGADAMHIDEDALNDAPENLAWGSRKENMNAPKLKARQRESRAGELHPNSKLTNEQVLYIRQRRGEDGARDIAQRFGIRREYVYQIWSQVARVAG
jgi:hypothetical protein